MFGGVARVSSCSLFNFPRSFLQPLDRDPPYGYSLWQVLIQANDDGGASTTPSTTEVWITLIDINDNAPFLQMVSIDDDGDREFVPGNISKGELEVPEDEGVDCANS